jgi:hypothetical protein
LCVYSKDRQAIEDRQNLDKQNQEKQNQDRKKRTGRRGQAKRTASTTLSWQYGTAKTGHFEQNNQDKIAGTGQPEKESLKRRAQMGKENGSER